jgi:alpha-L-arabinofuranosidase
MRYPSRSPRARLGALGVLLALLAGAPAHAQSEGPTAVIRGDASAPGKPMSDRQYGIFFEDINHGADGGLYPELVQNRSFEFNSIDNAAYDGLTAWSRDDRGGAAGTLAVASADPLNARNLNYLRLTTTAAGTGEEAGVAIRNSGFNSGVYVEAGKRYDFSFWARRDGTADLPVRVAVEDAAGTTEYAGADVTLTGGDWRKYAGTLTASATTTAGRLALIVGAPAAGTHVDLDMVSLFPQDTFKGRENGMRRDLAEKIAAMRPRFIRFPGGCIANVGTFGPFPERARVYHWKDTIGPLEQRPTNKNFWGYNQSYGLGYLEYFQFAEDLGAAPIPVVPVGLNACGGTNRLTTPEQLAPLIQDALDLIEFANGSVATEWGAKRAELGHPAPFGLKYIGLGNEESDPQFTENFPLFKDAIRAAHPEIEIISNSGPFSSGTVFDRNWQLSREQGADLVDEHYYNSQSWFLANAHRYDDYDRSGPHVFLGEYAARAAPYDNQYYSALSEAAFMTGLERNTDVVEMASYAPLLANTAYVNWSPDAIWFDNANSYGTPSYYVQRLFGQNTGDTVVPTTLEAATTTPPDIRGGIGVATWSTQAAYDDVRVTGKDGSVLFSDDFSEGAGHWTPSGPGGAARGTWAVTGGEYRQTSNLTDARSIAGSTGWSNYTLELTARKLGGDEGFLIMFGSRDSGNFYWWNLGGFNNTQSLIEKSTGGAKTSLASSTDTITTGQTYRIRIQVDGRRIVTWLDGRKVHDIVDNSNVVEPLYQVMTRDEDSGEVVLKVVNARAREVRTDVRLGGRALADTGTVTTLTADALTDENSFDEPTKVAPVERQVGGLGSSFTYDFPASSITFLRLHPAAAGPPGGPPPSTSPGAPAAPGVDRTVRIRSTRLRADRRRRVAVRIACGPSAGTRCRGVLQLRRGRKLIGARSFSVRAGRAATVRVRVSRAAYRRLARRKSARVTVTLRTRGSDGRLRRVTARLALRR